MILTANFKNSIFVQKSLRVLVHLCSLLEIENIYYSSKLLAVCSFLQHRYNQLSATVTSKNMYSYLPAESPSDTKLRVLRFYSFNFKFLISLVLFKKVIHNVIYIFFSYA